MSQDDALRVKAALTDVRAVVRALGLDRGATRNRRGCLILCPEHGEKTPSCSVSLGDSGTLRVVCFSCSFRGDVFTLIAKVYGLSLETDFREVLAIGADLAGIALEGEAAGNRTERPRPAPITPSASPVQVPTIASLDQEIALGRAVDTLSSRFPVAGDAGLAQGLRDRCLFGLAEAERWVALPKTDWVSLFEDPALVALRPILIRTKEGGSPYALFRDHRLLIPWRRPDGRVWSFQRRFSPKDGTEDPKTLGMGSGPKPRHIPKFVWPAADDYAPRECFPFGVDAYEAYDKNTDEVWWVEGASDALSLRLLNAQGRLSKDGQARRMVALGLPGTQTLDTYARALGPMIRGKRGIVGVDGDAAGQTVAQAWRAMQIALGARESSIRVPPEKDWNLFLRVPR